MSSDKFVAQLVIVNVKPKYYLSYLSCIPKGIEIVKKHGGQPVHQWIVEAGGGPEVIFLTKWPSFDAKLAANESMFKDPEFQAFMKEQSKKVYRIQDNMCMKVPIFDVNPVDDNTKVCVETFHVKGFPIYAAGKLKEGIDHFYQKLGPEKAMKPVAVLMPIAYQDFSMIVIWASKNNKWDPVFETWSELMKDAMNWPKMAEAHNHIQEKSVRFCRPFKADMIPKEV